MPLDVFEMCIRDRQRDRYRILQYYQNNAGLVEEDPQTDRPKSAHSRDPDGGRKGCDGSGGGGISAMVHLCSHRCDRIHGRICGS